MPSQRNNTDHQDNKAAGVGRNPADEAACTVTNEAAPVGEQTAPAGADTTRQGAEAEDTTMGEGLNTATQTIQRITDQFTRLAGLNGPQTEELAQRWSEKVQALAQASTVQAQGT